LPEGSSELAMVLSIDNIGKRYGLLPSEVMMRGSTFDLFILDAALSYSQETLLSAIKKTRGTE